MTRNNRIDVMRTIGLLCIILAHVSPPAKLYDLRNFDVVCMIIVMTMSYALSSSEDRYLRYLVKRIKRLLLPTWLFLTVFFIIFNFLSRYNDAIIFTKDVYVRSYGLIDGIGYVWIIRVYLLIAIISPIIRKISNSVESNWVYLLFIIMTYFSYEWLLCQNFSNEHAMFFVSVYLNYAMGFGVIALLAYRYSKFSILQKLVVIMGNLVVFALHILRNGYVSTQTQKYPPRLYYIAYGVFISLLLYELLNVRGIKLMCKWKWIIWLSKNSLWVYFWHIIPIKLVEYYDLSILESNYIIRFVFSLGTAVVIVMIQNYICSKFKLYLSSRKALKIEKQEEAL